MIGKRILFFEIRQDPNSDRVKATIPHVGVIIDSIKVKGDTKYLVNADDRDKPFEIFPEDIEKVIVDNTVYRENPATGKLQALPDCRK